MLAADEHGRKTSEDDRRVVVQDEQGRTSAADGPCATLRHLAQWWLYRPQVLPDWEELENSAMVDVENCFKIKFALKAFFEAKADAETGSKNERNRKTTART